MNRKYFKPKSLTWWASFAPLAAGVFIATEPLHGYSQAVLSLQTVTQTSAPVLINMGLAGIGLRGAIA